MTRQREGIVDEIRAQLIRIAQDLDCDASGLGINESIPASGFIDSAGLLELIAWFESRYGLTIRAEELTVDHLGTLDLMAEFALQRLNSI